MNSKKWLKVWFGTGFSIIALVVSINYIVDPFDIFNSKFLKRPFQINERFVKVKFLEENHHKYNSYIFGSSRIGSTDPKFLEKYLPGSKFYNMTCSSADIYDHLVHLEYFIKQGWEIRNLYIQIDIENMSSFGKFESDYLRKLYPKVANRSLVSGYLDFLTNVFPENTKGKIKENFFKHSDTNYYTYTKGTWLREEFIQRIKNNCEKHIALERSFNTPRNRILKSKKIPEMMAALKRIKELCRENNINLIIFITPHNQNLTDWFVIDDYMNFLEEMAKIVDYYDFSGYNSVTTNNCYYMEMSHYIPYLAKLVAARIFNDNSINVPEDFGKHITKNNVKEHIKKLRKEIIAHDAMPYKERQLISSKPDYSLIPQPNTH